MFKQRTVLAVSLGILLAFGGAYLLWPREEAPRAVAPATVPATTPRADHPARLGLSELLEPGPALKPTAKAMGLNGKRVRMVGFMAQMELPPMGGFYLAPRPVRCDEAGGGTADLPPDSVLILSKSAGSNPVPFTAGALEVTGVFEVGNRVDKDGRTSVFRLALDGPSVPEVAQAEARQQ